MKIDLTDTQAVSLADRNDLSGEQRAQVAAAQRRLDLSARLDVAPEAAGLVADIVTEAEERGRVIYQRKAVSYACPICGVSPEPIRYKRGRNKGSIKSLGRSSWIEFASRFVTIQGHATLGCCVGCATELLPVIREELRDVRAQVPDDLRAEGRPRWRRFDRRRCTECGWHGHAGEMSTAPAMIDGVYRAGCPTCGATNRPLGRRIVESVDGFEVAESQPGECEVCDAKLGRFNAPKDAEPLESFRCHRHAESK